MSDEKIYEALAGLQPTKKKASWTSRIFDSLDEIESKIREGVTQQAIADALGIDRKKFNVYLARARGRAVEQAKDHVRNPVGRPRQALVQPTLTEANTNRDDNKLPRVIKTKTTDKFLENLLHDK